MARCESNGLDQNLKGKLHIKWSCGHPPKTNSRKCKLFKSGEKKEEEEEEEKKKKGEASRKGKE